jgi:2-succinyl-6-hydroxy-2,4-cyclohexadiene-1-carboxylate synthase
MLYFECSGDTSNSPVVLLHGFMGNTQDWAPVMQRLATHFFCLAIDLPGHGKSLNVEDAFTFPGIAAAIVQVFEANRVTSAPIIGYSMGGRIALYLAVHYPHLCSALIVESATAGIRDETLRSERRCLDDKWVRLMKEGVFEQFLRTWYAQPVFSSLAQKPAILEKIIKRRRSNDPKGLVRALEVFSVGSQTPLWDHLPSLALPVLLITGEQDKKYVDLITDMATKIPASTVVILPDAGHNVHMERPEDFAEHIIAFLTKKLDRSNTPYKTY